MASDIYDLYSLYKNKDIDNYFIYEAFSIITKKEQNLSPYIKDLIITEDDDNNLGTYSNDNRIIKINKKNINNTKTIKCKNVLGLQVLKHEIEHAKNLQKLEQWRNDIESKTIFYSIRDYILLNDLEKTKMDTMDLFILIFNIYTNYETNPGERMVDIKSWKYLVNLLKNQRRTEDLLLARSMLYYSYLRGYKDNRYYLECPTYDFLLNTKQFMELKKLKQRVNKNNYSLDTRLLYGLPITYEEYNNATLKKVKLQKKPRKQRKTIIQ